MNYAHHLIPLIGTSAAIVVIVSVPVSAQIVTTPLAPVTEITKTVTSVLPKPVQDILPTTNQKLTIDTDKPSVTVESDPVSVSTPAVKITPQLPSAPTPRRQQASQPQTTNTAQPSAQPSNATVAMQKMDHQGLPVTLALQELPVDYSAAPLITNSRQASASDIVFQIAVIGLLAGAGTLYYAVVNRRA